MLFDQEWRVGVPLVLTADGPGVTRGEEDLDGRLLGLLLAGLTDQATAHQLGVSLRTVQRRVRVLMELAGVETRMQLGYQAARRGWI